jgi:hypothetical protein
MNLAIPALLTFCGLSLLAPQDPAKPPPAAEPAVKIDPSALKQLEWLCGTWVLENGKATTEEHWRPLQGSTILGSSHTYTADRTQFFEHLRITAMRGTLAYVAMPGGDAPTVFPIRKLEQHAVEFANEKHDYPQLIRYEKTGAGVTATISKIDGSKAEKFVFKKKG